MNARIPSHHNAEITDCFKRYTDQLYRHLVWRTYDRELSQDLVQQVMMEVALGWERYRQLSDESLPRMLYDIADKRAIDAKRKGGRIREYPCPLLPDHPAPPGNGTEETAIASATIDHFMAIMRSSPRRQAEAATLYYLHGWSNAEIADKLKITRSRVTRLLDKAEARLRAELGPYLSGSDGQGEPGGEQEHE